MSYLAYALAPAAGCDPAAGRGRVRDRRSDSATPGPCCGGGSTTTTLVRRRDAAPCGRSARSSIEAGIPTAIKDPNAGKSADYQVEHSSFLFAYSPDGRAHVVYAQGFKPSDYAHDLPLLLKFRSPQG